MLSLKHNMVCGCLGLVIWNRMNFCSQREAELSDSIIHLLTKTTTMEHEMFFKEREQAAVWEWL